MQEIVYCTYMYLILGCSTNYFHPFHPPTQLPSPPTVPMPHSHLLSSSIQPLLPSIQPPRRPSRCDGIRHYRKVTAAVKTATNCDESSASTLLQKRRSYSTKETQLVREYFADHIARGQSVSLRECAKFLAVHQIDRSEKNIQDNTVKNLLKALPEACRLIPSL